MKNKPNMLESAGRGAFDTATFGFGAKAGSLLGTLIARQLDLSKDKNETFADAYKRGLALLRQQNQEAFEANPVSYGAGGVVGALASPIKGGQAVTLGQRVKRGALLGGLYGVGTSDSGDAGSFEPSNAFDTAKGAGIGSLAEVLLPPTLRGTGYVANKLTPEFIKEGAANIGSKLANTFGSPSSAKNALAAFQPQVVSQEQNALTNLVKQAPYMERGELAGPAINKIQQQHQLTRASAGAAYDGVKAKIGSLDIKQIKQFVPQIKEALVSESIDPSTHKKTYAYMTSFNNILGKEAPKNAIGIDFKRLEGWRKQLGKAISREADEAEKYGLIQLKKGYDDFLNNNIEKAMLKGDPKILREYEAAREGWANYKKTYTAAHKDEYGKKFIQDIINNGRSSEPYSNEMIANKIFGTNKLGFKPQSINIVNELKSHLGTDSQEFHGLRLEGMKKVLSPLLENPNNKAMALEKYNANLREQMPVLKELLPPSVVKELEYVGQRGGELFKGNKKFSLGSLSEMKYVGPVINLFKSKDNTVSQIYNKGATSDIRLPEAATRSITSALMLPESPDSPEDLPTPKIPTSRTDIEYEAIIARMTPEQKERLNQLQQSMSPAQ